MGEVPDAAQVAQVDLGAQHVDARDGVLPAEVGPGAGAQSGGCAGGVFGVRAQRADRLERLLRRAGCGQEDEVGCEGSGCEELVDEALAGTETNAAVIIC